MGAGVRRSVGVLKALVWHRQGLRSFLGWDLGQLRLCLGGRVLEDGSALSDYNIQDGCVIDAVRQ